MAKTAGAVHVFEPNPICLAMMKRLSAPNIIVHPVALSSQTGETTLRFDPGNTGIGTIEPENRLDQNKGIRRIVERVVHVRRMDDFALPAVGFIKVDVEGHEAAVVQGALATIEANKPILLVESELRHNPHAFADIEAMLRPLGYSAWYLAKEGLREMAPGDLTRLQSPPGPYVNNFFFVPDTRPTPWLTGDGGGVC